MLANMASLNKRKWNPNCHLVAREFSISGSTSFCFVLFYIHKFSCIKKFGKSCKCWAVGPGLTKAIVQLSSANTTQTMDCCSGEKGLWGQHIQKSVQSSLHNWTMYIVKLGATTLDKFPLPQGGTQVIPLLIQWSHLRETVRRRCWAVGHALHSKFERSSANSSQTIWGTICSVLGRTIACQHNMSTDFKQKVYIWYCLNKLITH